jgi:hypothetical protein
VSYENVKNRGEVPVPPEYAHLPRHVVRLYDPRQAFHVRSLETGEEAVVVTGWRRRPITLRARRLREHLRGAPRR